MFIHERKLFEPVGGKETPEKVAFNRRRFLQRAAVASLGATAAGLAGYVGWRYFQGSDSAVIAAGQPDLPPDSPLRRYFPIQRDTRFTYERAETTEAAAARHTNFYEFTKLKNSWRYIQLFRTHPWTVTVDGLCRNKLIFDMDELMARFAKSLCERQYRQRCVERWAIAVPWAGFPLRELILAADPLPQATHVRFVAFHRYSGSKHRPDEAPATANTGFPWPYTEGLTLHEAANELTLLATGMYGHPLLKQHGAPVRLVVPWKYGYKSIKSIERIELVDKQPLPFWTELRPKAYPFESNVNPADTNPWPQKSETMLGSGEEFATQLYNGYGEYVAKLYG